MTESGFEPTFKRRRTKKEYREGLFRHRLGGGWIPRARFWLSARIFETILTAMIVAILYYFYIGVIHKAVLYIIQVLNGLGGD